MADAPFAVAEPTLAEIIADLPDWLRIYYTLRLAGPAGCLDAQLGQPTAKAGWRQAVAKARERAARDGLEIGRIHARNGVSGRYVLMPIPAAHADGGGRG